MAQHFWPYGLPPETGGIALNLAGLGSLCRAVDALHGTSLAPVASAAADLICCSLLLASAFKLLLAPGAELVAGAGGIAEGIPERFKDQQVPKFRPGGLLIVRAGGTAGLFSAIIAGWAASGSVGSSPVTREVTS